MNKSESIQNIAKALLTFQTKIEKIKKDSKNPFFKSKYASLSNILDNIQIPLAESGLSFSQHPDGEDQLTTILMHADSGEWLQSSYFISPVKKDPQAIGSSITYSRRYALVAILGLNIEEDDDGNKASGNAYESAEKKKYSVDKDGVIDERPWLSEAALEKMKQAISEGRKNEVIDAMPRYRINNAYKAELESCLAGN